MGRGQGPAVRGRDWPAVRFTEDKLAHGESRMRSWRAQGCGRCAQEYISPGRVDSHVGHVGLHIPCEASEQRVSVQSQRLRLEVLRRTGEAIFVVIHQTLLHTGLHLRRTNKTTSGNRGDSDIRNQHRLECPGYSQISLSC